MKKIGWVVATISAVAMGCIHRNPHEAVLAPLGRSVGNGVLGDSTAPQYIAFNDELTESVFKDVARSGRYKIAGRGTQLLCPSNKSPGLHGYRLWTHVDALMGDSALATIRWSCRQAYQGVEQTVNYLLRRRNGEWQIERAVSGGISLLVRAPRRRLTNVAADDRSVSGHGRGAYMVVSVNSHGW